MAEGDVMKVWVVCTALYCVACGGERGAPQLAPTPQEMRDARPPVEMASEPPPAAMASEPPPAAMASEPPAPAAPVDRAPAAEDPGRLPLAASTAATPVSAPAAPETSGTAAPATGPAAAAAPAEEPAAQAPAAEPPSAVESDPWTVTVSFTFDDSYQPQLDAAAILEAHGLRGTFYVNSPLLHAASANPDSNYAMSISDVLALQARGHDIGGHTLGHLSLPALPESERIREILGDRAQLVRLGIAARSFAYPYGDVEADLDRSLGRPVLEIARGSGYSSARDTNGFDLSDCAPGPETLPPQDPFILRSVRSVNEPPDGAERQVTPDTAATLLAWIDQTAGCGGGWLPLIFHHLRTDCSSADAPARYCFDFKELDLLAANLATGRRCPGGTAERCYRLRVATVSDAIGATDLAPAPEVSGLRNPSLERALDSGETECIQRTGGSETAIFSRSHVAQSGQVSERLAISAPYVAPAEIGVTRDFGECSIFATEGRAYDLSLYYRAESQADVPTLRFVTYRLTSAYEWRQWETSVAFSAKAPGTWVRRAFTTAAVPEDTIAISFGLRQESAGVINVDDLDAQAGAEASPAPDR